MHVDHTQNNLEALASWQGELACPACLGTLRRDNAMLACSGCGRVYPVVDGIPVLIADRAEQSGGSAE